MTAIEAGESTQAPDRVEDTEPAESQLRRSWVVVGVVIAMLVGVGIGLGIGWLVQDDADESSYVVDNTVVSGNDLTERQREMVDVTGRYVDAWIEGNGDAVASFMVPEGYVYIPTLGDRTVRADDRTLQTWVENLGQIPNELNDPIIVEDDRVVLVGRAANLDWMISIEFTTSGDAMIVSDTHWAWSTDR
jgi:hypothetical protein